MKTNSTTLEEAKKIADVIYQALAPLCERIEVAGSIRRGKSEVNDIDIVLIVKPGMMNQVNELCLVTWAEDDIICNPDQKPKWGERIAMFWYMGMIQVDLYFANPHTWPVLLLIRTGSKEHNIMLCNLARDRGMYLAADGSGLYADRLKTKRVEVNSEDDIFSALGLDYVEPEARE